MQQLLVFFLRQGINVTNATIYHTKRALNKHTPSMFCTFILFFRQPKNIKLLFLSNILEDFFLGVILPDTIARSGKKAAQCPFFQTPCPLFVEGGLAKKS